jgi:hypothetical protein
MAQINVAPNGNYTHRMSAVVSEYNVGSAWAKVHFRYWIDRHISAASGSFLLSGGKLFRATVDGDQYPLTATYDWRNYSSRTMVEGDNIVPMSAQKTINFGLYFEGHSSSFPAASGSGSLVIPWTPPAPTPLGFDEHAPTSLRYRFSSAGTGGSPILEWQAQIATDAAFTQNLQTVTSSGTSTFSGLVPGTPYRARSRGRNAVGWGAWSAVSTDYTLGGGRVKNDAGTEWDDVLPWVKSDANVWEPHRPFVRDLTVWQTAR